MALVRLARTMKSSILSSGNMMRYATLSCKTRVFSTISSTVSAPTSTGAHPAGSKVASKADIPSRSLGEVLKPGRDRLLLVDAPALIYRSHFAFHSKNSSYRGRPLTDNGMMCSHSLSLCVSLSLCLCLCLCLSVPLSLYLSIPLPLSLSHTHTCSSHTFPYFHIDSL
jgi:hypothetical protein